jgi:hypothetical protein
VNGKALGPRALIGSTFISNLDGFPVLDHGARDATVEVTTYWRIELSDADAHATGVSEVRLLIPAGTQASTPRAYLIARSPASETFTPVNITCDGE